MKRSLVILKSAVQLQRVVSTNKLNAEITIIHRLAPSCDVLHRAKKLRSDRLGRIAKPVIWRKAASLFPSHQQYLDGRLGLDSVQNSSPDTVPYQPDYRDRLDFLPLWPCKRPATYGSGRNQHRFFGFSMGSRQRTCVGVRRFLWWLEGLCHSQDAVANWMAVIIIEFLEVVDVADNERMVHRLFRSIVNFG